MDCRNAGGWRGGVVGGLVFRNAVGCDLKLDNFVSRLRRFPTRLSVPAYSIPSSVLLLSRLAVLSIPFAVPLLPFPLLLLPSPVLSPPLPVLLLPLAALPLPFLSLAAWSL